MSVEILVFAGGIRGSPRVLDLCDVRRARNADAVRFVIVADPPLDTGISGDVVQIRDGQFELPGASKPVTVAANP